MYRPDVRDLDAGGRERESVLCGGFIPYALTKMRGRNGLAGVCSA